MNEYQREQLNQVAYNFQNATDIVVDTETNGLLPFSGDRVIGIALYFPHSDESFYLPYRHGIKTYPDIDNVDMGYEQYVPADMEFMWKYFADPDKTFFYHNAQFDIGMMYQDGFPVPQRIYDTMIAAHLMNENKPVGLKPLAERYFNDTASDPFDIMADKIIGMSQGTDWKIAKSARKKAKGMMWRLPPEDVAEYAMQDVELTWELYKYLDNALDSWNLFNLYDELCNKYLLKVIIPAYINGMLINGNEVSEATADTHAKIAEIQTLINENLPSEWQDINPNSNKQVPEALDLANAQRLTLQVSDHPAAKHIDDYKKANKVIGTFYTQMTDYADMNGYLHPSLNITGTKTGRLSCSKPNLQQYPRTTDNFNVRRSLVAPEGYTFVAADFAQLELRIAVHYAQEETMLQMFNDDVDPHQYTADQLNIDRHAGKTANFGFLYGMGAGDPWWRDCVTTGYPFCVTRQEPNSYLILEYDIFQTEEEAKATARKIAGKNYRKVDWDYKMESYKTYDKQYIITYRENRGAAQLQLLNAGIDLSHPEVKAIVTGWHDLYPAFKQALKLAEQGVSYKQPIVEGSHKTSRFVKLFTGRVRHYKDIRWKKNYTAWNSLIQGTASEVNRITAQRIADTYSWNDVKIVMLVHDSAMMYIKTTELNNIIPGIVHIGEDWDFDLPMVFEAKIGSNWGELEEYND